MTRRFLMVSPFFPPMNYVGAKRALHFCRRLPAHGWSPAVVALPAAMERDPALDPLVPDVPLLRNLKGGPVAWAEGVAGRLAGRRTPADAPRRPDGAASGGAQQGPWRRLARRALGAVEPLDRFTRYLPTALPAVLAFARRHRCAAVYANAGPFSACALADLVGRMLDLPVVQDLRDPWSLEPNYEGHWTPEGTALVRAVEQAWFRRAARVVLNTESSRAAHAAAYAGIVPADRFTCIRNHYDPDLYCAPGPAPGPDGPLRLVYYGHLRPTKDGRLLLRALRRLLDAQVLSPDDIELVTCGEVTPADAAEADRLGLSGVMRAAPWLPFPQSPRLLGTADVLLDLMGPRHHLQISGKLYDYLAARRPILSVSPNAELDDLLGAARAGRRVPVDEAAVAAALADALRDKRAGVPFEPDGAALARLGAAPAAAQLAAVLDEATAAR